MTNESKAIGRLVLAFVIAPLVPGLLIALVGSSFFIERGSRIEPQDFYGLTAVSAVIGYPVALILGAPSYVLLRTLSLNSAWVYALAGIVFGGVLFAIYPLFPGFEHVMVDIGALPIVMLLSAAATLAFWLIARPDRQPQNATHPSAI